MYGTAVTPVPEINVIGNGVTIADGDTTPSTADHTDFGSADVTSGTITRTFTVQNTGTAALSVSSVTVSGSHAADFSVTVQPATSVAAGGNTTFQVQFNPSASGLRSASLSFGNGDADENPYNFSIQGTGTSGLAALNINSGGAATGSWIADAHFNTGNTYQTNATIDTSLVANPAPTAVYQNVRWAASFTYTIPGFTPGGSYNVRLHLCELTWTAANQRKFNVAINGVSVLSNYDVFAATGARYRAIAPQFNTTANGSGQIIIAFTQGSPVIDNPMIYGIEIASGTPVPEINVIGNGVTIADGDTTPSTADHTDFGSVDVASGTVTRTFTIQNTGNAALSVSSVTVSGTHAADFAVTVQPATSVAAGGNTIFQVQFNPSANGLRSASLSFGNGDADENPYNFSIQGTGTTAAPEINVAGNAVTIPDGDTTPSTADHTDFGNVDVASGTLTRTFTVQNTGSAALSVSSVTVSGTHAADFAVTVQPATSVAAGGNTTFQVQFDPSASGLRSASLSFGNGDADENPYNFSIQGTGTTTSGFWRSGGSPNTNLESESHRWGTWRGRPVDMALAYPTRNAGWGNLHSTTSGQVGAYQDHSIQLIIQISPFPENVGASWSALVAGSYDTNWRNYGAALKAREDAGFVPVIVSVAWEANGTYMFWGGCGSGMKYSSPAQYIAGYQRIVNQMRVTYPNVRTAWIMNGHNTPPCIGPDSSVLYPGDAYVTYIGVDYYDHFPSAATQAAFDSEGNSPDGIWWFLQMARNHGKQFLVPEWGIAPGSDGNTTGDNANFITWMFGVFQNAHGTGHMGGETYFDDPCGGGNVDSDIINGCNPLSAARYLQLY